MSFPTYSIMWICRKGFIPGGKKNTIFFFIYLGARFQQILKHDWIIVILLVTAEIIAPTLWHLKKSTLSLQITIWNPLFISDLLQSFWILHLQLQIYTLIISFFHFDDIFFFECLLAPILSIPSKYHPTPRSQSWLRISSLWIVGTTSPPS